MIVRYSIGIQSLLDCVIAWRDAAEGNWNWKSSIARKLLVRTNIFSFKYIPTRCICAAIIAITDSHFYVAKKCTEFMYGLDLVFCTTFPKLLSFIKCVASSFLVKFCSKWKLNILCSLTREVLWIFSLSELLTTFSLVVVLI